VVPRITGGPLIADAATWIGVQDPEGSFFQIGTTESEWFGSLLYDGFWSDPVVGFHAQKLLAHNRSLLHDLQSWEAAGKSDEALEPFLADAALDGGFSNAVRSELGLPPV
jgi:hypothetical protein